MIFENIKNFLRGTPRECVKYKILYEEMERRIIRLETEIKLLREGRI